MDYEGVEDVHSIMRFHLGVAESELQIIAIALEYILSNLSEEQVWTLFCGEDCDPAVESPQETHHFIEERYEQAMDLIKLFCLDEYLDQQFRDWKVTNKHYFVEDQDWWKEAYPMAFGVRLEDERGNVIESLNDPGFLGRILPDLNDPKFIMLKFIDPWGNTVFNRMQMETFIEEWKRIYPTQPTPEERQFLDRVEELAERCLKGIHLYLKFYGD